MSDYALMLLEPQQVQVFKDLSARVDEITQKKLQPIHTEHEAHDLNELRGLIKKMANKLEEERKRAVGPHQDKVKDINALYKKFLGSLKGFDLKAEGIQLVYQRQRDAEIRKQQEEAKRKEYEARVAEAEARIEADFADTEEEREQALARAQKAQDEQAWAKIEAPNVQRGQKTEIGTSHIRKLVDEQAIKDAIDQGVRDIPGVRIFQVWTYEIVDRSKIPDEYRKEQMAMRLK